MPEEPSQFRPIHYRWPDSDVAPPACGIQEYPEVFTTARTGEVTCFACRRSQVFLQEQGVGTPTPLPQRQTPKLLKEIIAEDPQLSTLHGEALKEFLRGARNERGMFVIEEVIHHGDYRSVRRVEVYSINAVTVDAVIQSSAYAYGSWLNPDNPDHKQVRNIKLHQLVQDLRTGVTNRDIGWSTFRLITKEQ